MLRLSEAYLAVFVGIASIHGCFAQELSGFSLIDSSSDLDLGALTDGSTVDLAIAGSELSVRADPTSPSGIGSVRFDLDGVTNVQTENVVPYALGGDSGGDYNAVFTDANLGDHEICATPFSGANRGGTAGSTICISITTVRNQGPTEVPSPTEAPTIPPTRSPVVPPSSESDVPAYNVGEDGELTGELKKWHKITLSFVGPSTSETATPNPFTYYRLDVTFTHIATGKTYVVPGYYGADGNAANTGATAGNVWLTHFAPDEMGTWQWSAGFTQGTNVAQNGGGSSAGFMDGKSGTFDVMDTDKTGRDHRGKGRLQYVGEHHLRFAETGEYFLKAGADSPENFLAYDDFDNTLDIEGLRKDWGPHLGDYRTNDPTWAGGKGGAMVGALNYLSGKGMNVFSFLPMNIAGDDENVFPYISDSSGEDRQRIDVSKTAQWEVVFEHADHVGLYLHFKTQETENDQLLDGGALGNERKLYYRELIARFSHHLALNWNIGEENTNTVQQRKDFADFFKAVDPYDFPVVIHTYPNQIDAVYGGIIDHPTYDGASIQTSPGNVFDKTLQWVQNSEAAGRKWVVANDEQGSANSGVIPDANDFTHDNIRKNVLWGNIMAGGAGVEYYFGYQYPNSDLTCEDWRSRDNMWTLSKYALDFFTTYVPFWEMSNNDDLVSSSNAWCLSNELYFVIYLLNGGTTTIDLPDNGGTFDMSWYDPRNGGDLQQTTVISGGQAVSVGTAPSNTGSDWAILITPSTITTSQPVTPAPVTPSPVTPAPVTSSPETHAPVTPSPVTPSPVTSSPITPAPVTQSPVGSSPITPAPVTPSPITPAPVTPSPITPAPVTLFPVTPVPVTPSPVTPAPTTSAPVSATSSPTPSGIFVSKFILVDAVLDEDLYELSDGNTLVLADFANGLNIVAVTEPQEVGSVRFKVNGNNVRTENVEPYALGGDSPRGNYYVANDIYARTMELTATPYSGKKASGTVGTPLTITIEIVDESIWE